MWLYSVNEGWGPDGLAQEVYTQDTSKQESLRACCEATFLVQFLPPFSPVFGLWQFLAISADSEAGGEKDKRLVRKPFMCSEAEGGGGHIAQVTLAQGSKQHFKM